MQNFSLLVNNEKLVSIREAYLIPRHIVGNYNVHFCFFHPIGCTAVKILVCNGIFSLASASEILNLKIVNNYAEKIHRVNDR